MHHTRSHTLWISKALAVALAATALSLPARGAQEPAQIAASPKLTLEQSIAVALERQPIVQGARASRESAYASLQAASSPLGALTGPIIHVRRKQAELGVAVAQAGLDQSELETINAVTRTYLSVLYASEQLRVAEDIAERFKGLQAFAEGAVKAGTVQGITTADVDRLGTYRLLAESRQAEARGGIARATAALREAMGLPYDHPLELAEDRLTYHPVKVSTAKAVETAIANRQELIQAMLASEITGLEVRAQGLTLHSYARTFAATADIHAKVLPATVMNGDYRPGALGPEMPVYLAGSQDARIGKARHLYDRAVAVANRTRGLVSLETQEICIRINEQTAQTDILKRAAEQTAKQARDAEKAFRADQLKADQMVMAQVLESQTRAQANEAVYKYGLALAALHRATGGRFWECVAEQHKSDGKEPQR